MEQSTLDEIFTLLEPWLRRDCPAAREMSITILHSCLETYLQNVDFKGSFLNEVRKLVEILDLSHPWD